MCSAARAGAGRCRRAGPGLQRAVTFSAATTGPGNLFASVTTADTTEIYDVLTTTVAGLPGRSARPLSGTPIRPATSALRPEPDSVIKADADRVAVPVPRSPIGEAR
jgi:hypothetical protein